MWDLQTETILFTVRDPVKGGINSVAFAPDGRSFATASSNHIAEVWDAQTGTPQHQLQGHTDFVTSVAFSPDGSRIATSSADSTLRVWDARKGRELLTLGRNSGFINAVTFSPDGKRLVSTGRSTRVWDADSSRYEPAPPR
jgi:WD40 repeat protein